MQVTFGGKYKRSFAEYHAIPEGWDPASLESLHAALQGKFNIRPLQVPPDWNPWFKYRQTLYNIAEGLRYQDTACVELAIQFIELHFIGSYSGFIRSLMARRLKHAPLTADQKERLSRHFLNLLRSGERCHEFRIYLKLWRSAASPGDISQVEQLARETDGTGAGFLSYVLASLRSGQDRRIPT